jgi:hypothetical protein
VTPEHLARTAKPDPCARRAPLLAASKPPDIDVSLNGFEARIPRGGLQDDGQRLGDDDPDGGAPGSRPTSTAAALCAFLCSLTSANLRWTSMNYRLSLRIEGGGPPLVCPPECLSVHERPARQRA